MYKIYIGKGFKTDGKRVYIWRGFTLFGITFLIYK
jgi:hypothetical protein